MKCSVAVERLLEADLAELALEEDTDLTRHLAICERCRTAAARIVKSERDLSSALGNVESRIPVDVALGKARERARGRRRITALRRLVLPLAAAGIAGLLFVRSGGRRPIPEAGEPFVQAPSFALDIEAPADRNVAVFESKARPGIVVVWFY